MSWIGGDLGGLQAMGNTMKPAQGAMGDIVKALSSQVDKVVNDAGYSGDAATSFRAAWTATSIRVGVLATATSGIGQALGTLGDQLQQIEADLYNTAQEAKGRGAQIGQDGKPLSLVITGNPDSAEAKQAREAQKDYTATYDQAIHTAQGYRLQAAKEILEAMKDLTPPKGDSNDFSWDKVVTVGDYVRGLWTIPNEKNSKWSEELPDKVKTASAEMDKAQDSWRTAHDAYTAAGKQMPADDPAWANQFAANKDLSNLQTKLAAAETGKGELPLSKALNVKIADAGKMLPGLAKVAPKGLDFLKDIPVVDVAASAGVAELQARDDIRKGQDSTTARAESYGAAAVGLAAGAGVAAAAATTAPVWAVAAGAGAVCVGVGDVVYDGLHQHWSEDWHDDGVWGGTMHGLGGTFSDSWSDIKGLGTGIGHGAASLWHKVF